LISTDERQEERERQRKRGRERVRERERERERERHTQNVLLVPPPSVYMYIDTYMCVVTCSSSIFNDWRKRERESEKGPERDGEERERETERKEREREKGSQSVCLRVCQREHKSTRRVDKAWVRGFRQICIWIITKFKRLAQILMLYVEPERSVIYRRRKLVFFQT